jgi:hypothetical protein
MGGLAHEEETRIATAPVEPIGSANEEPGSTLGGRRRRVPWNRILGPTIVVVLVMVGNFFYLVRYTDPNPLGPRSNLVAATVNGPLPGLRTIDPNNGFITQAIGHEVARQVFDGQVPLWNSYQGVGSPLLASGQAAAAFPPTLLNRWPNGLFYETLLLELVAGLSTLFLMRRLRVSELAAVAAGVAYALNGTFSWLQNGAMLPVAFLPLILLGVERARDRATRDGPSARGGWITLALAIALAVFAGFVETVYIYGFLIAAWTAWRFVQLDRPARRRFAVKIVMGVTAGGLISALMLVPFVEYLRVADIGGHEGVFSMLTLPTAAWSTVLGMPYAFGPIFAFNDPSSTVAAVWSNVGGYLSATLVVLGMIGMFGRRERGLRLVLGAWIVFCLAKTFGPDWFLRLVNLVPGMDSAAFYRYMSPALSMAVIVLAAFAIDDLVRGRLSRVQIGVAAGAMAVLLAIAVVTAYGVVEDAPGARRYFVLSVAWAISAVAVIVVVALSERGRALAVVLCAVVVVDVVVTFGLPTLSAPRDVVTDTRSVDYLAARLGEQRYFTYGPIGVNYGSYFELGSALATDVPMPKLWSEWVKEELGQDLDVTNLPNLADGLARFTANPDAIRFLGVSHVVTQAGSEVGEPLRSQLTLVHRDSVADVYELDDPKPYFDVGRSSCRVTSRGRNEVVVDCDARARLVRREVYFPDWEVTIDGRSSEIEPARALFQAVDVPAGRSVVRFSYAPPRWTLTIVAFAVGVLWVIVALVLRAFGVDVPQLARSALRQRRGGRAATNAGTADA